MRFPIAVPVLTILLLGVGGCATFPDKAEQKSRMSRETFSDSYRVAVTAYQREADIDSAVMKTTMWTLLREPSVDQALSKITFLDKIDRTMADVAGRLLPARTEIIQRDSYGANTPISGIDVVADDAMLVARDKEFNALLFVAVQPILTTTDVSGTGSFRVQLLGLTQLHKVTPGGDIGGDTVLMYNKDIVNCPEIEDANRPIQLKLTIDSCVGRLATQLKASFEDQLKSFRRK